MKRNVWLGLGLLFTTGCATLVHGPRQEVRIESTPPGATATISPIESQRGIGYLAEKQVVTTPATVKLYRDNTYRVDFEKAGYGSARADLVSHYDWFWGQLACGPCEALADLPKLDTDQSAWPIQALANIFYEYPRGFIGGWGKGARIFSPDALLGGTFNLKPKDAGYWNNFHALGTPEIAATLPSK
jgi:hypothetical protein